MMDRNALEFVKEQLSTPQILDVGLFSQSPLLMLPSGNKIESIERFQENPNRNRCSTELRSCRSFCAYVNRFATPETTVYIDVDNSRFSAVIDHHEKGQPSWGDHTALFSPKLTQEWRGWLQAHEQWQGQLAFAHLLERLMDTIADPTPNRVLQAAIDFEENENLTLSKAINLDNGAVRFNFVKGDTKSTAVEFPHRIALSIAVHDGQPNETFEGRIRYKIDGEGRLLFQFSFVRDPDRVQRESLLTIGEGISSECDSLPIYEGVAPKQKQ